MPAKSSAALVVATALVLGLPSCGADTAATTRTAPAQTSPEAADCPAPGLMEVVCPLFSGVGLLDSEAS